MSAMMSAMTTSFPIISHHFPSFPIISHHFPSFPIISHWLVSSPELRSRTGRHDGFHHGFRDGRRSCIANERGSGVSEAGFLKQPGWLMAIETSEKTLLKPEHRISSVARWRRQTLFCFSSRLRDVQSLRPELWNFHLSVFKVLFPLKRQFWRLEIHNNSGRSASTRKSQHIPFWAFGGVESLIAQSSRLRLGCCKAEIFELQENPLTPILLTAKSLPKSRAKRLI